MFDLKNVFNTMFWLSKCLVVKMFGCQNVWWKKCLADKMFGGQNVWFLRQNVGLAKCLVYKMLF
jgi:hypothetical protein